MFVSMLDFHSTVLFVLPEESYHQAAVGWMLVHQAEP
jgi:hypothetical protein